MTPAVREREAPFWSWLDALLFLGPVLLLFAVPYAVRRANAPLPKPTLEALVLEFAVFGVWFLVLGVYFKMRYGEPLFRSLGWRLGWPKRASSVWLGPAMAVVLGVGGKLIGAPEMDPLGNVITGVLSAAITGVFAVLIGPAVEELIFRGFLLPLFVRSFGTAPGIVLAAAPFALMHGPQYEWAWQYLALLLAASVVFGWVRVKTGSTAASTLVHAGYNLVFFIVYLTQRKDLFS
ncbi:MAG: CPBP family intramembrane metalloprotease [Bryobacterales bacterium]|nr:CPBP family intramembrane metalloprotease [Bryobacterales bacterium]